MLVMKFDKIKPGIYELLKTRDRRFKIGWIGKISGFAMEQI